MSYQDFQNQVSSEKLTLAVLHASKRLRAWSLHSGSIYKLENFDVQIIESIEQSGNAYTEVQSIGAVTASKFYNDRDNQTLYLRTTSSVHPDSVYLVLTFKLFFASGPVVLPHDLDSGSEVFWEPSLKSTSAFGVEIDTANQTSEAIEGSGTLTLINDSNFWSANYDKLVFENKSCYIYSYNRNLDASEAKLIFRGVVENKSYTKQAIQFTLKDLLAVLREPVALTNIEDLAERTSDDMARAKQRMIFGRVYGHRLTNLDEVLDGYPLTGTISVGGDSNAVTGTGTTFLADVSPNDQIVIEGVGYTIATVPSDTSLTLSENYSAAQDAVNIDLIIKPENPKRYMNRRWLVAGHALRQPTTTIQAGSSITRLKVDSTKDIRAGDWIYIGTYPTGELALVDSVVSATRITLSSSLLTNPLAGTTVFRPAVQNVRIDDVTFVYGEDYDFDASTGILEFNEDAERNSAPVKQMANNLTFTSASRTITGTALSSILKSNDLVGCVGEADFFEVLSVDSETQATLRTASTFSSSTTKGLYKTFVLNPESSVVTCDVLGRTADGTPEGDLIDSAPKVVKALLEDLELDETIDYDSFEIAEALAYQPIGLVIPQSFSDEQTPTYRDVFNRINPSVFGCLVQTTDFQLGYVVLQPDKKSSALRLDESDILDFQIQSSGDKLCKTTIAFYRPMEYNYLTKNEVKSSKQKTSEFATYLVKTKRENTFETILCDSVDAERHAARWATILETSSSSIRIKTKLQAINLDIGSIVEISHRKLYERFGSTGKRKLALVESVKKTGSGVEITLVDLSNAFNRIASIMNSSTPWSDTDEDGKLYGGFITDEYGLIDNDPDSAGQNLIW